MKESGITVVFYLFGIKLRGQENSQGQIAFNYSKQRSFGRLGSMGLAQDLNPEVAGSSHALITKLELFLGRP